MARRAPPRTSSTPRRRPSSRRLLQHEAEAHPELDLYLLRPPIVLGPHAVGAKDLLPERARAAGQPASASSSAARPCRCPCPSRRCRLQLIHEDDVGQAFLQCIVAAGPPGAYNITGDGVLTGADVARELGLAALPIPAGLTSAAARASRACRAALPPARGEWVEAASHAVDHGREQGQARARLAAALHEPRGAARHDRRLDDDAHMDAFDVDIAIIGSGFSGLAMAIRLKQEGIEDFTVLERGDDVGGTWHFNTYPGCACDVPSHLYSFSFAPNPGWTRRTRASPRSATTCGVSPTSTACARTCASTAP